VRLAAHEGLGNLSFRVAHVLVPPALEALLAAPGNRVQAFLAAGHVCSVMGISQYPAIASRHRVPIVVSGFEPLDILDAVRRALLQLEQGRAEVENAYGRFVATAGNPHARAAIEAVFECCPRHWRGIGPIPASGWRLAARFAPFDAERRFPDVPLPAAVASPCRSGEVLRGAIRPTDCPAFGRECTPRTPLGPTMVTGEGACAAYHAAGRTADGAAP
jgi:hydrogenase expression/formation protein HypD